MITQQEREKVALYVGAFVSECVRRGATEACATVGGSMVLTRVQRENVRSVDQVTPVAQVAGSPDPELRGERDAERMCLRLGIVPPVVL